MRSEDFAGTGADAVIHRPALSILLYRVDCNATMRAAWSAVGSQNGRAYLPLDLHFLLTPWADNAEYELRILGCAMTSLEATPHLSGPLLDPLGDWAANEVVQLCLDDVATEDVMRIFDSLPVDYKLSVGYVARVVRLEQPTGRLAPPVATAAAGGKGGVEP